MKLELRSLRAINCGPLRDVCIDFCDASGKPRPITVLGGANGSGKTTVLELITTLSESLYPIDLFEERPFRNIAICDEIAKRKGYAQMDWLVDGEKVSLFFGVPNADTELAPNHFGIDESRGGLYIQHGDVIADIRAAIHQQSQKNVDFPPIGQPSAVQESSSLPFILYFPHNRYLLPVRGEQINREKLPYQWVYCYETIREFRGSLDSYLIWLDYADPETFQRVIQFLNDLNLEGKRFSINKEELKVVVTTKDGQTHYLENLSSGEQNILIMLLELRRRLIPHSIVLIDEIENSLHPAFQYRLANALKKMQQQIPFQLIVTTHAPAFLDIFGTESARILTTF